MGVLRPAVRFAFDNSIGSISDPIAAQNGIAVFHSLHEKGESFKPLEEVRANINRTLIRENKIVYAKNFLTFIFSSPAGTEIISLNTGTIRPNNTALSPYFSNHFSTRSNFFSETRTRFKYFSNATLPNFNAIK